MLSALRERLTAWAKDITTLAGAIVLLNSILYAVFKPHIEPWLEMPHKIGQIGAALESNSRRLGRVEKDLADLRPRLRVIEFDPVRSRVLGPCIPGQPCFVEFRLRRTEEGRDCEPPRVEPKVVNHGGITRPVQFINFRPVKIGVEFETIKMSFQLPVDVLPGIGEFFVALSYRCPVPRQTDETETPPETFIEIQESTPTLVFQIVAKLPDSERRIRSPRKPDL